MKQFAFEFLVYLTTNPNGDLFKLTVDAENETQARKKFYSLIHGNCVVFKTINLEEIKSRK